MKIVVGQLHARETDPDEVYLGNSITEVIAKIIVEFNSRVMEGDEPSYYIPAQESLRSVVACKDETKLVELMSNWFDNNYAYFALTIDFKEL